MRILQVPHAYAPVRGGAEHYCTRASEALAALGHEVHVFTADFSSPEGFYQLGIDAVPSLSPAETRHAVTVTRERLTAGVYRLSGLIAPYLPSAARTFVAAHALNVNRKRFTSGLLEELEAFQPDVVMTLPHLFTNVLAVLDAHEQKRFPLVMVPMLHEDDPHWSVDEVSAALAQADAVIALTAHEADRIAAAYGVPESSIFTCSGGVELPAEVTSELRAEVVLYLGRKVLPKGIADLVAAMQHVWPDHPSARLVLAGTRTPETDQVDRLLEELSPEDRSRVTSPDDITEEAKHALLSEATCLVLPSSIESFGLVILEAWGRGTPVVALDIPIFRDLVEAGHDGLLVSPASTAEMAQAIRHLLADQEGARAMGQAGRAKAERMTWSSVAGCMDEAFTWAVRSARRS